MEKLPLKLTDNLILESIDANNYDENKLIAISLGFSFFGHTGIGYVVTESFENEDSADFAVTEIIPDLCESFNDLINQQEHWQKMLPLMKSFAEEYEQENDEYLNSFNEVQNPNL